jgi:radical SAM family uncharacterized protein
VANGCQVHVETIFAGDTLLSIYPAGLLTPGAYARIATTIDPLRVRAPPWNLARNTEEVQVPCTPEEITRALDEILPFVQKPARYTGGEYNSVIKPWDDVSYRLALVFPEVYELGMSNLGLAILYDIANSQPDMLAERAFLPWVDMMDAMRRAAVPLYSLESRHPLRDFDVLGFSLPYEQVYTNALAVLDLAGIPLLACNRDPGVPLVLAGGSAVLNPEPMHAFFDAFFLGEGEEAIVTIVATWIQARRAGLERAPALRRLAQIPGIYVPAFYHPQYYSDGRLLSVDPLPQYADVAPRTIVKRILPALPPPPTKFVVPFVDIVHNRASVEIQRGCARGCRFCQAGMIYRPVRERPLAEVLEAVEQAVNGTGFDEVCFLSLSASDYSHVEELVGEVAIRHGKGKLSVGLPSLRIDTMSVDLTGRLEETRRRSGFTFAPEAATDRLRGVINKPIATQSMLDVARQVFGRGWRTIKLYFMIGHPTQTLEDVEAIADLAHQVRRIGFELMGKRSSVRVAVSTLVPKPHTPFQWLPMADDTEIREQIAVLERRLRGPGLTLSWNDPRETLLEAALSRGDRRLSDVIQRAWELGAVLDGWGDRFNHAAWRQAFGELGIDPNWYARRERATDEVLPWDHFSVGVTKRFLRREYERALTGQTTEDCREMCSACGILTQFRYERESVGEDGWGCPPLSRRSKLQVEIQG